MKELKDYIDEKGFICHKDDSGALEAGDGAQRLGMYYLFQYFLIPFQTDLEESNKQFLSKYKMLYFDGEPTRHWNTLKWYGKKGTFSRDQLVPILAMLGIVDIEELKILANKLVKRYMFCWNTLRIGEQDATKTKIPDFCGPKIWAMILRALSKDSLLLFIFYPIICILDLLLLVDALVRVLVPLIDREDSGDDLNFTVILLYSKVMFPTPVAYIARRFYHKCRPLAGAQGFRSLNRDVSGPVSAFRHYFYGDKNPPLDVLAEKVIEGEF